MKKVIALLLTCIFAICFFTSCNMGNVAPTEENFNNAISALDNYTLKFKLEKMLSEYRYTATLKVDGAVGYLTNSKGFARYFFESDGSSVEKQCADYSGYVYIFKMLKYNNFEYDDGWLYVKGNILVQVASMIGYYTIMEAKLKISNERIMEAYISAYSSDFIEMVNLTYKFSNYGSTSLPL